MLSQTHYKFIYNYNKYDFIISSNRFWRIHSHTKNSNTRCRGYPYQKYKRQASRTDQYVCQSLRSIYDTHSHSLRHSWEPSWRHVPSSLTVSHWHPTNKLFLLNILVNLHSKNQSNITCKLGIFVLNSVTSPDLNDFKMIMMQS